MFEVVPCPTPTRATTDATPMTTPSIVSAARSRLVRSRERARRRSSSAFIAVAPRARAGQYPGQQPGSCGDQPVGQPAVADVEPPWRGGAVLRIMGDEDDRATGAVELTEKRQDVAAGRAVEVTRRL